MPRPSPPLAVVVVAKAPRPGAVKTRLCPPLTPVGAAALHQAFLRDTLDRLRVLRDVRLTVAYTPVDERPFLEALCPGVTLLAQSDGDLGRRLTAIFATLFADGFRGVVAIGADTPMLPPGFVRRAFDLLRRPGVDVVLGPATDGGYYLIGLKQPQPGVFRDIPWGTGQVYAHTTDRAAADGLRVARLPAWSDVDTFADLTRLAMDVERDGAAVPHTRAQLVQLGLV